MSQRAIPFLLFRGGTSRGPYFRMDDLPKDRETLADVLIAALGSGHRYNIDGIGGGVAVTTKVAILTRSQDPRADIDYLFAQVLVEERRVDFRPTCGNILSGVGPAAIEMGLFEAQPGETRIRIRAVNTGALVDAMVQTPAGTVSYEGRLAIDGVPGTSAPIQLSFRETVGSVTGSLLPTGNPRDLIDGIEVTCLDVAMPVVIARAEAFGLTGAETPGALDANAAFAARREAVRIEAGKRMGMGDVAGSVTPKFAILGPPCRGGSVSARYFMPTTCHPTMAVTGAQCIAASLLLPGSVAADLVEEVAASPTLLRLEHPSGHIDVVVDYELVDGGLRMRSAGIMRTARLLVRGEVMVPRAVWP
ncbi:MULTISPECIES: 4-oxalomesaconate tautomerase [Shinella]|uniref:4-oxalomesaconate tautomerase n=1 Tax=Shinella sedimenti TaxID=2919913 RepID=A0ABT0CNU3_9HYPH|nr:MULTISPECIES: 4-oxalomesaconate tautomerase [Shinella]MCJ8150254.1 4-oxalomesaconate tautomerase [Shinella sedimenti]